MSNHRNVSDYYDAERPELVSFLAPYGPFENAIDIGCANGKLGTHLMKKGIVLTCDGIEPVPAAATIAKSTLRTVWQGPLENVVREISWQDYDLVILADVLEHLVDPWSVLRDLRRMTGPECRLALSVPNIRHYKIVLPLLFRDTFRYQDHGIMDRTHLHFFTRSSLAEILLECGWSIKTASAHMKKKYRRFYYPTRLIEPLVAVQHMVFATKT